MDTSTLLFVAVPAILLVVALKNLLSGAAAGTLITSLNKEKPRVPPGSTGLPLLGDILRLITTAMVPNPELFINGMVARHGAMFTTHLFGERSVFSADPSFNRLVLNGDGRIVETGYPSTINTLLGANSVLVTHGPAHKGLHALALSLLGYSALPPLVAHVDRLVMATMGQWELGETMRLVDEARKIAMNLNIKHLLSIEPGPWSESIRCEFDRINDGLVSLPFPLASVLPFTDYGKALKARKKVVLALEEVIRKRMDEKDKKLGKDTMDLLLEADGGSFSMEQMVDFSLNLLAAGYDTTSLTMALAAKFLAETPTALAQLREEHDSIRKSKGENQPLEWSDYQSMAFTQCVINETLRVGNIASMVLRRANIDIHFKGCIYQEPAQKQKSSCGSGHAHSTQGGANGGEKEPRIQRLFSGAPTGYDLGPCCSVKSYIIPKGCRIMVSSGAVHLNNEHYENARTFHPWRWQSKNNKVQDVPASNLFSPFGGGPRQCPGNELARVVVSVFLHHLVTRFSWDEAEEDKIVSFPTRTLKGYPINLRLRCGSTS